jgi:predicted anti-sigma-YlaC factor YlaD
MGVLCAECRQGISARLDGEDDPRTRAALDAHLISCPACRRWQDNAARVTRLARTGVAQPTPDLVDAVLARSRVATGVRWRAVLRVTLALIGVSQLVLFMTQVVNEGDSGGSTRMDGGSLLHFTHESAAWNIAVGIGFIWIAWKVGRAAGLVPTLTAFVAVLILLTGWDIGHGQVGLTRLSAHVLLLVGYVIVLVLAAPAAGGGAFHLLRRGRDRDDPSWPVIPRMRGWEPAGPQDRSGPAGARASTKHDAA